MAVKTIQSVQNALVVLEALATAQPIGVSALARAVDIDKTAVQRILLTLGDAGWIRQLDSGEWAVTSKALQVGTRFTSGLREAAHPHLVQLQKDTDESVVLFAREGDTMVVLDSIDSGQPLRMTVPVGMVVPMGQAAAFDAFLPDAERAMLPTLQPVPSEATLAAVRRTGYFVIDEMYPNSIAAGSPVFDRRGLPIGTITVVAPKVRVGRAAARKLGEVAARTAAGVTSAMAGISVDPAL
ncbi:MAG: IclR family transcriptional regulator [Ilumatobacteraceae bacterium]|nr:IclR family transcriptional regulator [Ilumatobacteraceae bacterium]